MVVNGHSIGCPILTLFINCNGGVQKLGNLKLVYHFCHWSALPGTHWVQWQSAPQLTWRKISCCTDHREAWRIPGRLHRRGQSPNWCQFLAWPILKLCKSRRSASANHFAMHKLVGWDRASKCNLKGMIGENIRHSTWCRWCPVQSLYSAVLHWAISKWRRGDQGNLSLHLESYSMFGCIPLHL